MQSRRVFLGGSLPLAALAAQRIALPSIRLGLAGFDGHADEVLGQLPNLPEVHLAAVADARSDPAAIHSKLSDPYVRAAKRYPTLDDMLAQEKLDVVAVCNNDGERAAAIIACAEKRIHVLAEKPLAIRRRDLDAVYQSVQQNRVHLGMLLPMRFDPQFLAMKQIVERGDIGEVLQIDSQKSYQLGKRPEWQKQESTYGSTILWIGIHMIDLMSFASGRKFAEVASFQSRVGFPQMGDMETVTASCFRLDNGGTATLRMDYLRPAAGAGHGDDRLRLAGTKGVVEYQEATGVTLMTATTPLRTISQLPPKGSVFVDFLAAIYSDAKPKVSWEEIVHANEATFAAHDAAERHALVKIGG